MNCKLKTNKNERGIWGFEFGLTEMCFPSPGSRHKYKLTMILRQHHHYIGGLFAFLTTNYGVRPLGAFPRSATILVHWVVS